MAARGQGWRQKSERRAMWIIRAFTQKYGGYAERWERETDDRRLFVNVYRNTLEALEEMGGIRSSKIWVAWYGEMEDTEESLDEIISYFTGQTTRGESDRYMREPEEAI